MVVPKISGVFGTAELGEASVVTELGGDKENRATVKETSSGDGIYPVVQSRDFPIWLGSSHSQEMDRR